MRKNLIKYSIYFAIGFISFNMLNNVEIIPYDNDLPEYIRITSLLFVGIVLGSGSLYIADKVSSFIIK